MLAAEWGAGQVLWSILWFFLFVLWIGLLITVFADIIRSDLSGWGKAMWTIGIIVLPLLGVFLYLIVNGSDMDRRARADARATTEATDADIPSVARSSPADQLDQLAHLHEAGKLTDNEYATAKARVIGSG